MTDRFAVLILTTLITITAFLTPSTSSAQSQDDKPSAWVPKEDCGMDGSNTEMGLCADKKFKEADQELNRLYKIQMDYLTQDYSRKNFQAAERAWIAFRDADCGYQSFENSGWPGTAYPIFNLVCKFDRTVARIRQLEFDVACRANDCPY